MPINDFLLTKPINLGENNINKLQFKFNNNNNNQMNKLCERTNKLLNSSDMISTNTNTNNNIKLFSQTTINESPLSGSTTIRIGLNNNGSNNKKQQQNKFKSENLNNTSVSDKIISKVMHTTSSKDSGKILKRSNIDKNKKISAFSVQCYNLAEKERYRQLLDQNICILHTNNKTNGIGGGGVENYYQNLVKTAPKEVKDDNALHALKLNKFPLINEKIELPVSSHITPKGLTGYSRRISRLNSNSNNSIISLSSLNGTSNNNNNKINEELSPQIIVINEKKAAAQHNNKSYNNDKVEKLNNSVNTNGTNQNIKQQVTPNKNGKSLLSARVIAPTRKIMRQLNDYELSHDQRFKQKNDLIESIFESIKAHSGYSSTTSLSEEEYKFNLLKRRRKEEELKLAKEFSERLQLNVNKLPQYYFEEETIEDEFPELTEEQQAFITKSLIPHPEDEILAKGFNIDIKRRDIQTLRGLNWLNDEIINFYMNLICARNEASRNNNNNDVTLTAYAFSTFFYPRLVKDGFQSVKRWTKKINLFNYGIILVPVHLGLHWTLAVIDISNKEIRYYDSMNGYNNDCLRTLKNYIRDEHLDKKGISIDLTQWNALHVQDVPQQMNGSDCGMFTCKYAEFISRGKTTFSFNQSHMPYYRRRMVYEIITKQLL